MEAKSESFKKMKEKKVEEREIEEKLISNFTIDNLNVNLSISESPQYYDYILIPTTKAGLPGDLGKLVLSKLNISAKWNELIRLENFDGDFYWINDLETEFGKKEIGLVKTETKGAQRVQEITNNIIQALRAELRNFSGTRVWIPLIGTGSASIPAKESLNSIMLSVYDILGEIHDISGSVDITIALPRKIDSNAFKELFESQIAKFSEKSKVATNVPSWIDNPEVKDYLNRTPLAKSIASILNSLYKEENKGSIMIHLQGSWGAGKSTFLNILEKQLNPGKEKKWVVVKYNAWKNQHIKPPWWSFLNSMYQQSKSQVKNRFTFWLSEILRRWKTGKVHLKILTLIFFILTVYLFILILPNLQEYSSSPNSGELFELVSTIFSLAATIFIFFRTITSSLLGGSTESASTFVKLSEDPMEEIKKHFNSLIKSINKPVAIYIDDLDRCNPEYVVNLLEGIQTLFKDSKAFYIVAADKRWIAKCFEIQYARFKELTKNTQTRLGYKFLQKMFQFSVRLPYISKEIKNSYWNYILKVNKPKVIEKNKEIESIFSNLKSEEDVSKKAMELEDEGSVPESMIRQAAVERLTEKDFEEKTEHILREHSIYLDSNPRSIKRLANYYNVFRNTLILEGKSYDKSKIVRWLVLNEKYPLLIEEMEKDPAVFIDIVQNLNNNVCTLRDDIFLKELIDGLNNDAPITIDDVEDLVGVY